MRSGRREKQSRTKKKLSTVVSSKKSIDCDELHLAPNEKTQPILWTEGPAGALMAAGSVWPFIPIHEISRMGFFGWCTGGCWVTQAGGTDICTNY